MNRILFSAALIAAITAAIHVFGGGLMVASPLLASSLDVFSKFTLYAVWHMASVMLTFSAAALFVGSLHPYAVTARPLVRFVSLMWLAFGMVYIVIALTQPEKGLLLKIGQWTLLLPVGFLGFWGSRMKNQAGK
jgi:hypothetical protein